MKKIYLACPYSDDLSYVRHKRFTAVSRIAAILVKAGLLVYSPISMTHPMATYGNMDGTWETWEKMDEWMLGLCDELWVLKLDGWAQSIGVKVEVGLAYERGMPVQFFTTKEIEEKHNGKA